eukprot:8258488-Alexandrium_andersonii.AAC.1
MLTAAHPTHEASMIATAKATAALTSFSLLLSTVSKGGISTDVTAVQPWRRATAWSWAALP